MVLLIYDVTIFRKTVCFVFQGVMFAASFLYLCLIEYYILSVYLNFKYFIDKSELFNIHVLL